MGMWFVPRDSEMIGTDENGDMVYMTPDGTVGTAENFVHLVQDGTFIDLCLGDNDEEEGHTET